jgi:DNA ligase (NAD+)
LQRAGDVIPQVVAPLTDLRTGEEKPYSMPSECPSCGTPVVRTPGEVAVRCPNPDCPAKKSEGIKHFVSKPAMDIDGVGERLVERLLEDVLIRDPADLYALLAEQLAAMERLGVKSAASKVAAIQASKERSPAKVLFALGIPHVGSENAELLLQRFDSIAALSEASVEEIADTPGIGPVIAQSVWAYFRDPRSRVLLDKLEGAGLRIAEAAEKVTKSGTAGPLAGKTFVLTGTLPSLTRQDASELIQRAGGRVTDSVSARTDYVVTGDSPGSKLAKAERLGITVLDEQGLRGLVGG